MLQLQSVSKQYGRKIILTGVDLDLSPGSLNVMVGSNGAGKSTLLRLIAQLERPTGGNITLHGRHPDPTAIAYLPQEVHFHPLLTVDRIIRFYAEVWQADDYASRAALIRWGLEVHADKKTRELSGGLRQRLGLAVLSLRPAQLILLDEPGLSLDPHWRAVLRDWLKGMTTSGAIALITTHMLAEWESGADRLLVCEEGVVHTLPAPQQNGLISCQPRMETSR